MSTTKLTRKEILAEDSVHGSIVWLFGFIGENRGKIGMVVLAVVMVIFGIIGGYRYLGSRDIQAQEQLGKGMDLFNAGISPDATNDPYSKGSSPTFRSDSAKYQAAAKEFSSIASGYSYSSASVVARYYLALSQLQLGQKQEAVKTLESIAGKNNTIGFLSKKALAAAYFASGNLKGAQDILAGMIKDPKCDLPKEDLSIQLSRILVAQGKQSEAVKVLREANEQSPAFGIFKPQVIAELDRLQKAPKSVSEPQPLQP